MSATTCSSAESCCPAASFSSSCVARRNIALCASSCSLSVIALSVDDVCGPDTKLQYCEIPITRTPGDTSSSRLLINCGRAVEASRLRAIFRRHEVDHPLYTLVLVGVGQLHLKQKQPVQHGG